MSSAEALLSFQFTETETEVLLEESCSWFGIDISFALERIEVFLGDMPQCSRLWTYFSLFRSNAWSLSWHQTLCLYL